VHESAEVMSKLAGSVTKRIYPGMGHTIVADEVAHVEQLLRSFAEAA
jgi:phospholipase/carboxylesterase